MGISKFHIQHYLNNSKKCHTWHSPGASFTYGTLKCGLDLQCVVHIRVTLGHLRVTIGHLRVTVGHLRAIMGHLRLTIGYLKATVVHIRVTLGHLRVTIGNFFLSFTPK